MRTRNLALAAVMAATSIGPAQAEPDSATIGNGSLYAIGVSTPDTDATAKEYQRVFGSEPLPFGTASNAVPGNVPSEIKMAGIFFPNFYIKLQQPVNESGPFAPFVRQYGTAIMNLQIHVQDAKAVRTRLDAMGNKWVLGAPEDFWAYIDAKATLGAILEPIDKRNSFPAKVDPAAKLPLAAMPVTHIGIAVKDAKATARKYSELFGIPLPAVKPVGDLHRWNGARCEKAERVKMASWKQGDIGIELIEDRGKDSIWNKFTRKHGDGGISIGFDVGDKLDEVSRNLEAAGGKLVVRRADGSRAYFDFLSTLGVVVELEGTSAMKACP
ncbi:VOC family protein [Sphingopyxis granuli]|uniref:VOC family protein n=1 Tax=Sphingopyxis granuli TaxID=267128 RepID=UPI00301DFE2E